MDEGKTLCNAIVIQMTSGQLTRGELQYLHGCLDSVLDLPELCESDKRQITHGEFIRAIKAVRNRTKCGLLCAKNACEYYRRSNVLEH